MFLNVTFCICNILEFRFSRQTGNSTCNWNSLEITHAKVLSTPVILVVIVMGLYLFTQGGEVNNSILYMEPSSTLGSRLLSLSFLDICQRLAPIQIYGGHLASAQPLPKDLETFRGVLVFLNTDNVRLWNFICLVLILKLEVQLNVKMSLLVVISSNFHPRAPRLMCLWATLSQLPQSQRFSFELATNFSL